MNDDHRLFWVEWGTLIMAWVRLTGGKVKETWDLVPRRCSGGLLYIGDDRKRNKQTKIWTDVKGPATLDATRGVIFEGGRAAYGGAIKAYGPDSKVLLGQGVQVTGNEAYDGGGIYLSFGAKATATMSQIHGNSARNNGAGVLLYRESAFTSITSSVRSNIADLNGGGVFLHFNSSFVATGSQFSSNTAGGIGGGVYADSPPLIQWTKSVFFSNTAKKGSGGGAYISAAVEKIEHAQTTRFDITSSTFVQNIATGTLSSSGGGLFATNFVGDDIISITDTTFNSNTAHSGATKIDQISDAFQTSGGGLHLGSISTTGANFIASDLTFVSNSATGHGGGATLKDVSSASKFRLSNWTMKNNKANTDGGGLALLGSTAVNIVDTFVLDSNIALSDSSSPSGWHASWYKFATSIPSDEYRMATKSDREEILASINFDKNFDSHWGKANNFGAHFSSSLAISVTGTYSFKLISDDGSVLKINGKEVSRVEGSSTCGIVGSLSLTAGQEYVIEVGYFDGGNNAILQVEWQTPQNSRLTTSAVTTTNELVFATAHGLEVNSMVTYHDNMQATITELNDGGTYYVLAGTAGTTMKLSLTCGGSAITIAASRGAVGNQIAYYSLLGKNANDLSTPVDSSARGGGLFVSASSSVNVTGPASFINNIADGGSGGGIFMHRSQGSSIQHGSEEPIDFVKFENNVARSLEHRSNTKQETTAGDGLGGGIFAMQSQIGNSKTPLQGIFRSNLPSGIHSSRSSMFLASPMDQYADAIVVGDGDFPFPVAQCPPGQWFPSNDIDPWSDLATINSQTTGAQVCYDCPAGYATADVGSTRCSKCLRGEYQPNEGHSKCLKTESGYICPEEGLASCKLQKPGFVVLDGASEVKVPLGSMTTNCDDDGNACKDFEACSAGKFGSTPPNANCGLCPAGKTSTNGSLTCTNCAKGKHASNEGSAKCEDCDAGKFQEKETEKSTECNSCPSGWDTSKQGESTCTSLGYTVAKDCNIEQYLNDTSTDPANYRCVSCPPGGSCFSQSGTGITKKEVKAKFGWSRCHHDKFKFEQCSFPASCLGGPNFKIDAAKFEGELSRKNFPEGCQVGYVNGSRLCGQCAKEYSMSGGTAGGKCEKCLDRPSILAIAVAGVVIGILCLVLFIQITLSDGGSLDESDGAKSIGLSFIQLISLLTTFPIAWPSIFTSIFQVGGAITVLGQNLVNLKCMYPDYSEAEVFYSIRLAWAALPPLLVILCLLTWQIVDKCRCAGIVHVLRQRYCKEKHTLRAQKTFFSKVELALQFRVKSLDEKMKMSSVALLYLVWPSLCSTTFSLFSCRSVCDEDVTYLRADLNEQCWSGRHKSYALGLGLPMLICYIIGLPLCAYIRVSILKRKGKINKKMFRIWGILYTAFREKTWWWEATVAGRKVVIALIGVFGASLGAMQVHTTLLLVMFIILLTASVRPFGGSSHGLNQRLELASLVATFTTLWAGTVFNTYPKCQDPSKSEGITLPWCDVLSIFAGSIDILVVVAVVVVFVYLKADATKDAEGLSADDELIPQDKDGYHNRNSVVIEMGTKTITKTEASNASIYQTRVVKVDTFMGPGTLLERRVDDEGAVDVIELSWPMAGTSKAMLFRRAPMIKPERSATEMKSNGFVVGSSMMVRAQPNGNLAVAMMKSDDNDSLSDE